MISPMMRRLAKLRPRSLPAALRSRAGAGWREPQAPPLGRGSAGGCSGLWSRGGRDASGQGRGLGRGGACVWEAAAARTSQGPRDPGAPCPAELPGLRGLQAGERPEPGSG